MIGYSLGVGGRAGGNPSPYAPSFYMKDYAGGAWVGTDGRGTSLGQDFASVGADPSIGADFGSHPSADFDGTQSLQATGLTFANMFTRAAYGGQLIAEFDSAAAPSGVGYTDALLIGDVTNGEFYVLYNTSGVRVGHYDGVDYRETPYIALATGVKACIQYRYDGTDLKCRVNGSAWQSVAADNLRVAMLTDVPGLVTGYASAKIDGRIAQVLTWKRAPSDAEFDALYLEAKSGYAVP